jgi:hypothetical protein
MGAVKLAVIGLSVTTGTQVGNIGITTRGTEVIYKIVDKISRAVRWPWLIALSGAIRATAIRALGKTPERHKSQSKKAKNSM